MRRRRRLWGLRWLMIKVGVGYRREMASWIDECPRGVGCLELTAEHFQLSDADRLRELSRRFSVYVHGLGLSLGTPGPLDRARLDHFAAIAEASNAQWVSEHIAFTRSGDIDLGHLNPVPPTHDAVKVIGDHAREVSERCGKPILLENITSYVRLDGELSEPAFLNALCERANCGLLLDVTNLFINSRNHGFDAHAWLREVDPQRIRQLHIVGYSRKGERYTDSHAAPIQEELIELARVVVAYAPVQAVILERDEEIPDTSGLVTEVEKLERIIGRR